MKIVVAPNAFKGSLSAAQAAAAMCTGVRRGLADAQVRAIPVADGGDGLLEALESALAAERHRQEVRGPLGETIDATFLYNPSKQLAVIEMAAAAGLALLDEGRAGALQASSEGVGQLMKAALDLGARHIMLGIGGSASTDGATGLASALGVRFLDDHGRPLTGNGANLHKIRRIDNSDLDERLSHVRLEVACDVDNPLLGETGAARIYAPQKGASPAEVEQLEQGLANLATVIKRDLGVDISDLPGGGAAGGLGAGLKALFNAELKPGAQLVLAVLGVEQAIEDADLVLTGEGRLDGQTRFGKAPGAVAALAQKYGVPCVAIAGRLDDSAYRLHDAGFTAVFSLCPGPVTLEQARRQSEKYLASSTEQVIRCLRSSCGIKTAEK